MSAAAFHGKLVQSMQALEAMTDQAYGSHATLHIDDLLPSAVQEAKRFLAVAPLAADAAWHTTRTDDSSASPGRLTCARSPRIDLTIPAKTRAAMAQDERVRPQARVCDDSLSGVKVKLLPHAGGTTRSDSVGRRKSTGEDFGVEFSGVLRGCVLLSVIRP